MTAQGTHEDALEIVHGLHVIEQMRRDINDMLSVMRICVQRYACAEFILTPEWTARVVIRDAQPPEVHLFYGGVKKSVLNPLAHMLPLVTVQPLWERLGDMVQTSMIEGEEACREIDIFRRAGRSTCQLR